MTNTTTRPALDRRLQVKALVLALQPDLAPPDAAAALARTAGRRALAEIATRRALRRMALLHASQPTERTARAAESLRLALARILAGPDPGAGPA